MKIALTKIQGLFNKLEALKKDKASKVRERREGLEAIPRYKELQAESAKLRESRKLIEGDFDTQNEALSADIESLKTKIEMAQFSLTDAMLEAVKEGQDIELVKMTASGEKKRIGFSFKVNFNQLTLGI